MDSKLLLVPIDKVVSAKDNPRKKVGDVDELAASIRAVGLLEPLVVTNGGDTYGLVAGARRLAGAKKAGLTEVPVVVRELTEEQRQEAMLIENLQREDLQPLEEAEAFHRLLDLPGYTQRKLAERLGRSQSHISKRLALLELPAKVRGQVDSGGITLEDAQELSRLKDHPKLLERALAEGRHYNGGIRRQVEAAIADLKRAETVEAEVAKLKAAGVRVLSFVKNKHYNQYELPKGAVAITKRGGYSELSLDPATHKDEPCHAAAVHPQRGDVVYLCTDRSNHPKLKTEYERLYSSGGGSGKSKARQAHERELRDATKARRSFVRELISTPRPRGRDEELELLIVDTLIGECWQDKLKLACEILAVEPVRTKSKYSTTVDYAGPLRQLAQQKDQAIKIALAIRAAIDELGLGKGWDGGFKSRTKYFGWLEQHGYEVSSAEKRELAGKAPR